MRKSLFHLAVLSISFFFSAESSTGKPIDLTLSRALCPSSLNSEVNLRLSLQSDTLPRQAEEKGEGWSRQIVLEMTSGNSAEQIRHIWETEDRIDRITSPLPNVYAALTCFEHGAGKNLSAAVLVFKSDSLFYWNEASFFLIRLPSEKKDATTRWQEHIPRMPLPRGYLITSPSLEFFNKSELVAVLKGLGSSAVPPILYLDISRKELWLHSLGSGLQLNKDDRSSDSEGEKGEMPPQAAAEWFRCSSLTACSAVKDYCGRLTGIRHDSVNEFLNWTKRSVEDCASFPPPWQPDMTPSLICEEERCSIRWVEKEHSEEELP